MKTERFSVYAISSSQSVFVDKNSKSDSIDDELKSTLSSLQKLFPSVFANKSAEQFVIAPDLRNKHSTAFMYLDESNFFYFIEKNEQNVVQNCFRVYGLQWLENVSSFNMVVSLVDNVCMLNSCSGYEALCYLKEKKLIKLELKRQTIEIIRKELIKLKKTAERCKNAGFILLSTVGVMAAINKTFANAVDTVLK